MKLSINLFTTLDGVAQGPGGAEEDPRGGFTRGGWLMPVFDEGCGAAVNGWFERGDALLLGRRTYDTFVSHWPLVTDPQDPVASALNQRPKYVVTSSPVDADAWADTTTVLGPDFLGEIRRLKEQPGDGELQVHGSVMLARALHEAGLVDVYRLLVAPVVVGQGSGIFGPEGPAHTMRVTTGVVTDNGVVSIEMTPGEFQNSLEAAVEDGQDVIVER